MDALGLWITVLGTLLTAIGTSVTLLQARKVRKYRSQIAFDLRKLRLSEVQGDLRDALNEVRKLITPLVPIEQLKRGQDERLILHRIQSRIDNALNFMDLSGGDADIRGKISQAQLALRDYQKATSPEQQQENLQRHHELIQNAISLCRQRIMHLDQERR
ncbi:MAG: hypothetical protein GVY18_00925 [Bacteroidetes bacterium]|jgi:signal transduction histidine kinase|nr:hypothetical protein [Bacteroidota bacterium]